MPTYRRWGSAPGGAGGSGGSGLLGGSPPKPILWLIAGTIVTTALGALLQRNGVAVLTYAVLATDWVWRGEIWRLFTWVLIETGGGGLNLMFGCLLLYFLGGDLLYRWGVRRFFAVYFGIPAIAGLLTCVVARFVWREVALVPYFAGMWPALDALLIGWAVLFPDRQILMYFVLPVSSRQLVYLTIGATVLMALINGFPFFVPHLLAELIMLLYMDVISLRRLYLRGRMSMLQRDYRRRTANLRMVDRDQEKPPRWMH
jgi:membrane associated rhomboid family serine protease